ncbi:MAG: hypothetical protein WDM85_18225 [Caulobacteraceae bacterium]
MAVIGGDADEAQACLDAGADEVLRKPSPSPASRARWRPRSRATGAAQTPL